MIKCYYVILPYNITYQISGGGTMAYSKIADDNYRKKYKYIGLKYTISEIPEYERIKSYCNNNGLSIQGYIKALIKADLDTKNIPYTDNQGDYEN